MQTETQQMVLFVYGDGARAGECSGNPLGKRPGALWTIPNVMNNHVDNTSHLCQFSVELIERLVLSLSKPGDLVVDPFMGAGTSAIAAIRHGRRAVGAEAVAAYLDVARERVLLKATVRLRTRPRGKPVHRRGERDRLAQKPFPLLIAGEKS